MLDRLNGKLIVGGGENQTWEIAACPLIDQIKTRFAIEVDIQENDIDIFLVQCF